MSTADITETQEATDALAAKRKGWQCTIKRMADILGMSTTTIENYIKKGAPVIHKGRPGVAAKLDSAQFIVWMLRQERERVYKQIQPQIFDDENYKARKMKAVAEKSELEVRKIKGELVDVSIVEETVTAVISSARSRLLGMPTKLAPQLAVVKDVNQAKEILEKGVYEALNELSRTETVRYLDGSLLEEMESATEPEGK